jgi:hypothetical protein
VVDAQYDLTVTPPRPGDLELAGWVWLPRMIDKARATYFGNPGSFSHPCGQDNLLLTRLGISVEEFRSIIENTSTDEEVAREIESLRMAKRSSSLVHKIRRLFSGT